MNCKNIFTIFLSVIIILSLLALNYLGITGSITSDKVEPEVACAGENPDSGTNTTLESGPETVLPWENDNEFLKACSENNVPVLMAAYRTVLRDPLPGEEYNVHLAAQMLDGIVVKPGAVFSQNQSIGPYDESRGFQKGPTYIGTRLTTTIGGGVCKIASTLYNVSVLSNLQIVERHNHSMPVPYVPYGQDATVAYGVKDFKFKNNTQSSIMIWAQGIDNVLYIALYGSAPAPKVVWQHETVEKTKAPVEYRDNPDLPAGTEKVILEGMDGAFIKSWVAVENPDGTVVTKQMGNSFYSPMSGVIERGR